MNIVYVYSGERKNRLNGVIHVDYPDTQLFGENHLADMPGFNVSYRETSDYIKSPFIRRLLGFRVMHLLTYFFTLHSDVVVGSSLYYALSMRKVYRTKTRYILLNFSLTRILTRTKKSRLARWFSGWILDEADVVICLSMIQKNDFKRALPNYKGEIAVVSLGVDDVYYIPHYEDREDFILAVGRDNGRDYNTVIEVARRLPHKKFLIVCSKRNLVGVGNIPTNVIIKYDVGIQELRELYYRAQLMLLVTHDDSFGDGSDCSGQTVLLDAMASGLPVIASRKKYIHEYARENTDALLVDFYDPDDIVQKIYMLDDVSLRLRLAKSARARVEREFSTRRMAENLYEVIMSISPISPACLSPEAEPGA